VRNDGRLRLVAGSIVGAIAVFVVVTVSTRSFAGRRRDDADQRRRRAAGAELIGPLVRLLAPVMERIFGVLGRIATDTLLQAPRRTSATVLRADDLRSGSCSRSRG